jgi:tRNA threonylcarbamoyladenosine biosynthesis protein TsaE
MIRVSRNADDTREIAQAVLGSLSASGNASVLALKGDLGAGKTNFAQEIGRQVGVAENMHSPTFVIMKAYEIDWKGFKKLIHIDAYRLEREEELLHLGWEEMVKSPDNLVVIEWPENVPGIIPLFAKRVSFKFVDESVREISWEDDALLN